MKTIAAFDFDGTITNKDTLLEFIRYVFGNGLFIVGFLRHAPLLVAYKCHLYPNWKVKRRIFAWFFKGMPIDTFNSHCGDFFLAKGKALLREQAVGCIADHIKACHEVVIVSASIDNWVLPFADALGVRNVIGTQVEISSSNCLTGTFITPNCYGREKVHRLL